ncbi:acetoin utilization protein AcuC [Rarobacter incanus]
MPVLAVAWSDDFLQYKFTDEHPLNPTRLDLTMRLAHALGLFDLAQVKVIEPHLLDAAALAAVHTPAYIDAVRLAAAGIANPALGLGTTDIPLAPFLDQAAALVAAGSVAAAASVWGGGAMHAINLAGGMHHARGDAAAGFCIYNDAALAIRWLLTHGARRVAYIDFDAHHGDGVQQIFWDEARVLTISVHEQGIFPYSGNAGETGGPAAPGTAVNLALPTGTGSAAWLRAIDAVVPDALAAFAPDVVVTQHGCDAHAADPLAGLRVGVPALRRAAIMAHEWAHRFSAGRWIALGGGGYEVSWVVPLSWTHLVAVAAHQPLDTDQPTPQRWLDTAASLGVRDAPANLGWADGGDTWRPWLGGFDPESATDRAIRATRALALAEMGVDVSYG